jgi:phosphoenolpyruvate synthase/pyruvate phosphate dikinase
VGSQESCIVPLVGAAGAGDRLVGGKAARLGSLIQAGFRVPRGSCITTKAKEMIPLYQRHTERGTAISPQALAAAVSQGLRRALGAVANADQALARAVPETKPQVRSLERAAIKFQLEPQALDAPQRQLPTALERALTESLRRAYSLTRRFVRVGAGLVHMPAQDA